MAGDLLLSGLSALSTYRNALDTTGHNIANANTAGYSRQFVEIEARTPQLTGAGYVGSGVKSVTVARAYDTFLASQFRSSSSATSELDSYFNLATQIDGVLADENIGLNSALQSFFNALQTVADDPTSIPARQVLLTEGEAIESRFGALDRLFDNLTKQVNTNLQHTVADANILAESIAGLNSKIVSAIGSGNGNMPNDLLDQRDYLIDKLSEKLTVSTSPQENGAVNVFIGSGQALVQGTHFNTLGLQQNGGNPDAVDVVLKQATGDLVVTKFMTGGEIGGTLRFRDEVLDPSIGKLGQIAVGLSFSVNEQHKNGIDLNGAQGLDFFTTPIVNVLPIQGNSVSVVFANTEDLTTSDYSVGYNGSNYTLTRLSDSTTQTINNGDTVDGLTFNLAAGGAAGDSYLIRPTRKAAGEISLALTDPRSLAAALPVISTIVPANTGSGDISDVSIDNLSSATLPASAGITLRYDAANKRYDVSGSGVTVGTTLAYDPSIHNGDSYSVSVTGFGTIDFNLNGQPANADTMTLTDNIGGVGDNRNANLLSDLQTKLTLNGGTASFKDSYGSTVADVGRRTQLAHANGLAQRGLLNQSIASKDSVSGVSLDEEAANLIKYQQAYQAASQVIITSRTIFDTLLGAFR